MFANSHTTPFSNCLVTLYSYVYEPYIPEVYGLQIGYSSPDHTF